VLHEFVLFVFLIILFVSSWMWDGWEWSIHWNNYCCKSEILIMVHTKRQIILKNCFTESRSKSACTCAELWLFIVFTWRSLPWLSTTIVNIKALYMIANVYSPGSDKQHATVKLQCLCVQSTGSLLLPLTSYKNHLLPKSDV